MITIRPASLNDIKPLQELFEQYREFYSMPRALSKSEQYLTDRLSQKDSLILMAFEQQAAAGFIQVYPIFSSVAMRQLWILNDLFVTSAHRKKGIARKLMQAIEIEAQKQSIFSIKLATQIDNVKAKALYESLNYKVIDKFDHYTKKL